MLNSEDIGRELDAAVETALAKARDTLTAAGVVGAELERLLESERRRLSSWREQTLEFALRRTGEPVSVPAAPSPFEIAITAKLKAAADQVLDRARDLLIRKGATPEELEAGLAVQAEMLADWQREALAVVLRQDSDPAAPSGRLQ